MSDADAVIEDLEVLLRAMVDEPDEVWVEEVPMRRATVFEVGAAESDLGKLIGRRGRTARSLRALLDCRGDYDGAQYSLDIVDD